MNIESTICAECGADYSPDTPAGRGLTCGAVGYAVRPDGARICYACAHASELREIADTCAAPRKDSRVLGYLSADFGRVTIASWTGRELPFSGHVTGSTRLQPGMPGAWVSDKRVSVRMRGPNGTEWIGRGYGRGMSILLRPTAATLRAAQGAQS